MGYLLNNDESTIVSGIKWYLDHNTGMENT